MFVLLYNCVLMSPLEYMQMIVRHRTIRSSYRLHKIYSSHWELVVNRKGHKFPCDRNCEEIINNILQYYLTNIA